MNGEEEYFRREEEAILYVQGSGWDLATIEAAGFSPCRMQHLIKLAGLTTSFPTCAWRPNSRTCMTNPVPRRCHPWRPSCTRSCRAKFVDHTHARRADLRDEHARRRTTRARDLRRPRGRHSVRHARLQAGPPLRGIVIFKNATPKTVGMVLMNHGACSRFGRNRPALLRTHDPSWSRSRRTTSRSTMPGRITGVTRPDRGQRPQSLQR